MKDYLLELTASREGTRAKFNIMREYLQAYTLRIMYETRVFHAWAFLGETALRFLHNLPRYSEDLDFSLVHQGGGLGFMDVAGKLKQEFSLAGYQVSVSCNDQKTVHSSFVKFEGLMYESGISPHKSQNFSIKIELDTNPPEGGALKTEIVNKYFPISFLSFDLPTLFSGKITALLSRKYTKGRDFFDIGWYLSRWKEMTPNIVYLRNALKQSGWKGTMPLENNWKDYLYRAIEKADWKKVYQDAENFLENPSDMNIFNKKNILLLLKK